MILVLIIYYILLWTHCQLIQFNCHHVDAFGVNGLRIFVDFHFSMNYVQRITTHLKVGHSERRFLTDSDRSVTYAYLISHTNIYVSRFCEWLATSGYPACFYSSSTTLFLISIYLFVFRVPLTVTIKGTNVYREDLTSLEWRCNGYVG